MFKSAVYPVCVCHDNDTAGEIYSVIACPLSSFQARLLISVPAYDGVKLKEPNYDTTVQTKDFIYLQKITCHTIKSFNLFVFFVN